MSRVLLLSNGHGEDLSAALVGRELQARAVEVEALPLVGLGGSFVRAGIPVVGPTREFSTGGLGYTSLSARLTELRQGQVPYLLGRLLQLWRRRRRADLIVAVGDVIPVLAAWLTGRPTVVYLVAYSSHYEGRLRLPWPCGRLLRSRRFLKVWSRDALTADDLGTQLGRPVTFLGNPFLDPVVASMAALPPTAGRTLAVLPGSRMPEALQNLEALLRVLALLPAQLRSPAALRLRAALVGDVEAEAIEPMAAPLGWRLVPGRGAADGDAPWLLIRGEQRLELHWRRFAAVLAASDLVLSMTGTAAEQAVGLGKPVLQLAGRGPQFTEGFAEAQRRLLGPGVFCAPGAVGQDATLAATAELAVALLARAEEPGGAAWQRERLTTGAERIGTPGGSSRMAAAIMELLPSPPGSPHG